MLRISSDAFVVCSSLTSHHATHAVLSKGHIGIRRRETADKDGQIDGCVCLIEVVSAARGQHQLQHICFAAFSDSHRGSAMVVVCGSDTSVLLRLVAGLQAGPASTPTQRNANQHSTRHTHVRRVAGRVAVSHGRAAGGLF